MSRVSQRIDGIAFDLHKTRHSGTVEIDADQADQLALGDVVVSVNVSTVADLQAKVDKDGNVARIAVLKHTETVVLDGEIKALLVERLGLYGSDTMPPPIRITPGERTEAQRVAKSFQQNSGWSAAQDREIVVDEETGEISVGVDAEQLAWEARQEIDRLEAVPEGLEGMDDAPVERLGRIGVSDLYDDEDDDNPGQVQQLGRIGSRDKTLAAFLNEND